jgi:hypothetical protein
VLIAHGAHKLFGVQGTRHRSGGLTTVAAYFTSIGLERVSARRPCRLTQFAGGILLATGFLTRWYRRARLHGLGIWKEHIKWGFFLNWVVIPHEPTDRCQSCLPASCSASR